KSASRVEEATNSLAAEGPVISVSVGSGAERNVTPSPSAEKRTAPLRAWVGDKVKLAASRYHRVQRVRGIGQPSSLRSTKPSRRRTCSLTGGVSSQPFASPLRKCAKKRFCSDTPYAV